MEMVLHHYYKEKNMYGNHLHNLLMALIKKNQIVQSLIIQETNIHLYKIIII